jgi:hypothetical protein
MILFPRRTYYLQAVLFLVVAVLAFGSGYLIGRGDGSYDKQVEQERAVRQKVLVQGRLLFDPGTGQPSGDENAVVMALPQGEYPKQLLSIQGVRPQDPPPGQEHPTVRSIVELGGDYARANASGGFDLVVPAEGKYWLLLISAHAARATNEPVGEADLAEIDRYFQLGEHLLNRYKYRWRLEEIRVGFNPIEIDFGQDQKSS